MTENYKFIARETKKEFDIEFLSREKANEVINYHKSFPMYEPTPLVELKNLAQKYNVKDIFVKDESYRFDLNAFKVLGGSYAVGKYIAQKLGKDISEIGYEEITSAETKEKLGDLTFITATDGNHGRGIAWTAKILKQKCVVYMPHGSAQERADKITKEGADVSILDMNYDDCVRLADQKAKENGWILVQDTAWEGYEDIPDWIMQGYMTMAYEAYEELEKKKIKPTHIFLQAGVGSLAAGATGFFSNVYRNENPIITIVEPNAADCIYKSAEKNERVLVGGKMQTIMAGLACGEPNIHGLKVLLDYARNYLSVPDEYAAFGMRVLSSPLVYDRRVIAGESGAAAFGAIMKTLDSETLKEYVEKLGIDENSVLLFFNTEGDTDKVNYKKVIWDGKNSSNF